MILTVTHSSPPPVHALHARALLPHPDPACAYIYSSTLCAPRVAHVTLAFCAPCVRSVRINRARAIYFRSSFRIALMASCALLTTPSESGALFTQPSKSRTTCSSLSSWAGGWGRQERIPATRAPGAWAVVGAAAAAVAVAERSDSNCTIHH